MIGSVNNATRYNTHSNRGSHELLLFTHPRVGVQVLVGIVNPGEDIETTACDETSEATGLEDVVLRCILVEVDDSPPIGYILASHPKPVFSHPDIGCFD
jgi:8-oxo-dGTP pyrophosphatase MutT (NUDIX family)